jgi:hypothetical protein
VAGSGAGAYRLPGPPPRQGGAGALRELLVAIHQVLMAGPEVEHIRWHFEDVFMGDSSAGEQEPVSPRTTAESAS